MIYKNIIIRSKQELDTIQKKHETLYTAIDNELYEREPKPESYPLMYQYKQGKPGESIFDGKASNQIGTVRDLRIDENGNLVGTVVIGDMYARANHFQGVIDNFVFEGDRIKSDAKEFLITRLVHFIVYDKVAKEEKAKKKEWEQRAQKLYNAPTEDYGNPREGNKIKQFKDTCDKLLEECTRVNPMGHMDLTIGNIVESKQRGGKKDVSK